MVAADVGVRELQEDELGADLLDVLRVVRQRSIVFEPRDPRLGPRLDQALESVRPAQLDDRIARLLDEPWREVGCSSLLGCFGRGICVS